MTSNLKIFGNSLKTFRKIMGTAWEKQPSKFKVAVLLFTTRLNEDSKKEKIFPNPYNDIVWDKWTNRWKWAFTQYWHIQYLKFCVFSFTDKISGIWTVENSTQYALHPSPWLQTFYLYEGMSSHLDLLPVIATLTLLSASSSFESNYT